MNREAEADLKKISKGREAEADLKKMTKGRKAEADLKKKTKGREADLEKMTKPFARFVRNTVPITSDVLTVTCAALDHMVMPSTLLETNTKLRLA